MQDQKIEEADQLHLDVQETFGGRLQLNKSLAFHWHTMTAYQDKKLKKNRYFRNLKVPYGKHISEQNILRLQKKYGKLFEECNIFLIQRGLNESRFLLQYPCNYFSLSDFLQIKGALPYPLLTHILAFILHLTSIEGLSLDPESILIRATQVDHLIMKQNPNPTTLAFVQPTILYLPIVIEAPNDTTLLSTFQKNVFKVLNTLFQKYFKKNQTLWDYLEKVYGQTKAENLWAILEAATLKKAESLAIKLKQQCIEIAKQQESMATQSDCPIRLTLPSKFGQDDTDQTLYANIVDRLPSNKTISKKFKIALIVLSAVILAAIASAIFYQLWNSKAECGWGQYQNQFKQCAQCPQGCAQCRNSTKTSCLLCKGSLYLAVRRVDDIEGQCVNTCLGTIIKLNYCLIGQ